MRVLRGPFLLLFLSLGPLSFAQERLGPSPSPGAVAKREDLTGGAGARLGDFRAYVFGAYSAITLLLLLYCARLASKQRALGKELEALEERLRK